MLLSTWEIYQNLWLWLRRTIGKGMKIFENLGENRLKFSDKLKIIKISLIISIKRWKVRNSRAKLCAFRPKMKKTLENSYENFENFDINLIEELGFPNLLKLTIFPIFTRYFWDFCLFYDSIYPWKIKSVSQKNLFYFGERWRSRFHIPDATDYIKLMFYVHTATEKYWPKDLFHQWVWINW